MYHVLNRAVARLSLFRKEAGYAAFERVMLEACERDPTRILAWCLMRNHWHFETEKLTASPSVSRALRFRKKPQEEETRLDNNALRP